MAPQTFRRLAWATAIASYALVVLGGTTKAYGAGLSCPDWPLCYGKLVPQLDALVALEWGHRLGALIVTALAVLTTVAAFRVPGRPAPLVKGSLLALGLLPVQAALGGLTVLFKLHPVVDAAHLALGTAFLCVWVTVAVAAGEGERRPGLAGRRLAPVPAIAAFSAYATMVLGSFMKSSGAGLACPDWPLCHGQVLPAGAGPLVLLHLGHRAAALLAGGLVLYAVYHMYRYAGRALGLVIPAGVAAGMVFVQVLLGGLAVRQALPPAVTVTHVALGAALVATLVALATVSHRASAAGLPSGAGGVPSVAAGLPPGAGGRRHPPAPGLRRPGGFVLDCFGLMKPRIVALLLITAFAAMWVAARGAPPAGLTAFTLLGLLLTCGGANAVNMWWDRDIDGLMARTRARPLPSGRLLPVQALVFGLMAGAAGVLVFAVAVNLLAAALALAGFLWYVLVYTIWLKRSSSRNIVVGGVAGAVPPLVGWAAVTGGVGVGALVMFLVVFLWTPPHFWALALFRGEDYRRAGVPMLPVVRGDGHAKWQIFTYALLVVPASLLLYWTGVVGSAYLWAALVLGVWFTSACVALLRECRPAQGWARRVFGRSIVYLAVLFLAMMLDVMVSGVAQAQVRVVRSVPEEGAVLAEPPAVVRLEYSQPVEPRMSTLTLLDARGRVVRGTRQASEGDRTFVLNLPDIPGGTTYYVKSRVMGKDMSVEAGITRFSVAPLPGAGAASRVPEESPDVGRLAVPVVLAAVLALGLVLRRGVSPGPGR